MILEWVLLCNCVFLDGIFQVFGFFVLTAHNFQDCKLWTKQKSLQTLSQRDIFFPLKAERENKNTFITHSSITQYRYWQFISTVNKPLNIAINEIITLPLTSTRINFYWKCYWLLSGGNKIITLHQYVDAERNKIDLAPANLALSFN